jgi:hypothetical protein
VSDPNNPNNPSIYDLLAAVGDHISDRLSPLLPQQGGGQSAGGLAQQVYDPYLGQYVPAGTPQSDPWQESRVDYAQGPTLGGNEFDAFDAPAAPSRYEQIEAALHRAAMASGAAPGVRDALNMASMAVPAIPVTDLALHGPVMGANTLLGLGLNGLHTLNALTNAFTRPQRPVIRPLQPGQSQSSSYDDFTDALHRFALAAGVPNPQSIDANIAAQANRPLSDVASEAWDTATLPTGRASLQVLPKMIGNALSSPQAGAGEPTPQQAVMAGATNDEASEVAYLQGQIKDAQARRAAAQSNAEKNVPKTRYTDPDGGKRYGQDPAAVKDAVSQAVEPLDREISGYNGRITQIQSNVNARNVEKARSQATGRR